LLVAVAVVSVLALSALPRASEAAVNPANWPDLALGCFDVTGDGKVDLANDILGVILHYNSSPFDPDPNLPPYALLYDVSGGGMVDLSNDILGTVLAYDDDGVPDCPLIDRQVMLATAAVLKYYDPAVAFADGYAYGGQYISNMGIHLINSAYQITYTTFYDEGELTKAPEDQLHQLTHPVGLVYSETYPGSMIPDEFLGPWYSIAVPAVCDFYSMPGPCQSASVQPVGFGTTNTDEDNQVSGAQAGWHEHFGLCVAGWGTVSARDWELGSDTEQMCYDPPYNGDLWFSIYGWMMHLYNTVPNPDGRFMLWNTNPDLP
jgi:hypothetical protein